MDADTLMDWRHAAEEAARRGAAVLEAWRSRFTVREKGRADLVTEADLASQRAVRSFLLERFPHHEFLGEEDVDATRRLQSNDPPTWIVDPLDGTTNYVHDLPLYCVSVGLQVGGEVVVGVVFDPRHNELFAAAKGIGAWLGSRRLWTSRTEHIRDALLSTAFSPDPAGLTQTLTWWNKFSREAQSLRRTGSTALNLAYVAAGRFDAHWGFENKPWDVAAGYVLVREAGGLISAPTGQPIDAFAAESLSTNGPLHPAMLAAFASET